MKKKNINQLIDLLFVASITIVFIALSIFLMFLFDNTKINNIEDQQLNEMKENHSGENLFVDDIDGFIVIKAKKRYGTDLQ